MNSEVKETSKSTGKKKRAATSRVGSRRSKSGVSDVHGNSHADKDTVRGLRLSRVYEGDPSGTIKKVRGSSEGLQPGELLTGIERKIAKLNGYRTLLKKKIILKGVPEDIYEEIMQEHKAWIESQVLLMIGEGRLFSDVFTEDEVEILKGMVGKVKQKLTHLMNKHNNIGNLGDPNKKVDKIMLPPVLTESALAAEPMVPPVNSVTSGGVTQDQMKLINQLEHMDRGGPVF